MYVFEFRFNVGQKLREKDTNLDVKEGEILLKEFPDGEFYARVIGKYLFSWGDIPGNDSERLVNHLVKDLKIGWAKNAEIRKTDDSKTINVTKDGNSLELKLEKKEDNKKEDKVILKIKGRETDYIVKKEKGNLNIYTNNIENEDCVVVQSIYNSDEFLKAILILDAIKRGKPKSITLVAPYLTYMRQDKIFLDGEALSAEIVLKELKNYADKIFLINSHNQQFRKKKKFKYLGIEIYNIDAFSEIVKYFKNLKNPKLIAPDKGASDTAKECAKILKCESDYLVKIRDRVTGKIVTEDKNLSVEGKDVLIADDIISSGGTMIEALKIIRKQNPASINLACVHGVFCDAENFLMLRILADELIATNSIPNKAGKIDLSELIAKELIKNLINK